MGYRELRLSANIQNLLTITGYNGYDPEIGASTADSSGYTYGLDTTVVTLLLLYTLLD